MLHFKHVMYHFLKALPDLIFTTLLLVFYFTGSYLAYSPTIQTIALKTTLVSLGFLHCHIVQGIAFPDIDWRSDETDVVEKYRSIALYVIFIFAYAQAG